MKLYDAILLSSGVESEIGKKLIRKILKNFPKKDIFVVSPSSHLNTLIGEYFSDIGFCNVFFSTDYGTTVDIPPVSTVYVPGGNIFEIAFYCRSRGLDKWIHDVFLTKENAITYIGCSAGAMLAQDSFAEAIFFDPLRISMTDFSGFGLLPKHFPKSTLILPHYTYKEKENYIDFMDINDKIQYENIYNINNEESLILRCAAHTEDTIELIHKKRIRLS